MKLTASFVIQILADHSLWVSKWPDLEEAVKSYLPLTLIRVGLYDKLNSYLSVGNAWQNLAFYLTCFLLLWIISVQHFTLKQPTSRE